MPQKYSLPQYIVGIDLETTSLDPANGEIIEVSAIRYSSSSLTPGVNDKTPGVSPALLPGEETVEYTRLTKPAHSLSAQITAITGITQQMEAQKPASLDIKSEHQDFIGDSLLFAHHASFDVGFLTHNGVEIRTNPGWYKFTLADSA